MTCQREGPSEALALHLPPDKTRGLGPQPLQR